MLFIGRKEKVSRVSEALGIDPEKYVDVRTAYVVNDLTKRFSVDSEEGRTRSLGMMCDDYAYELGLSSHCLKLIRHYATKLVPEDKTLPRDILDATLSWLWAVTRKCSESISLILSWHGDSQESSVCLDDERDHYLTAIVDVLNDLKEKVDNEDLHILLAYAEMNSKSPVYFENALSADRAALLHTLLLAKRLKDFRFADSALEIVAYSKTIAEAEDIAQIIAESEFLSLSGFEDYEEFEAMQRVNKTLDILTNAHSVLLNGDNIKFTESERSVLKWRN